MLVTITKPDPTITIHLANGRGNLELNRKEFVELHDDMTAIYNENYELIENDDDF